MKPINKKEAENSSSPNVNLRKYGVTDLKKAHVNALSNQVLTNKAIVEQSQAIVDSLVQKSMTLTSQLNNAKNNKFVASSNKNLGKEVINNAKDLMECSEKTYDQILSSKEKVDRLSKSTKIVINKLIYSAEIINKLSNLIIKKKAINPLIPDELINKITVAVTNANNAVALTMVALKSVYTSHATIYKTEASLELEYFQSKKLAAYIIGKEIDNGLPQKGIKQLLDEFYDTASFLFDKVLEANEAVLNQLNSAKNNLNKAQTNLLSSKASLAAANTILLIS